MFKKILCLSILFFFFWQSLAFSKSHDSNSIYLPKIIANYVHDVSIRYHFDESKLAQVFSHFKYQANVIQRVSHPFEKQHWDTYQQHFVTQDRILSGVTYWETHKRYLNYAAKTYGISPQIIVAIIGVETNYGSQKGKYITLNALTTLAFYHSSRKTFFKKELTQYLLLTRRNEFDPLALKSSYAGALGIPQFMPSTYNHYAVAYPPSHNPDLFFNDADSIVSIANYLKKHGWQPAQPIASRFKSQHTFQDRLISRKAKPKYTIKQLQNLGIQPLKRISPDRKAAIIRLENKNRHNEYWLTFYDFKVIMRYNPNLMYAMAVYQLSEAINQAYENKAS